MKFSAFFEVLSVSLGVIGIMILANAVPNDAAEVALGFAIITLSLLFDIKAKLYEIRDKLK